MIDLLQRWTGRMARSLALGGAALLGLSGCGARITPDGDAASEPVEENGPVVDVTYGVPACIDENECVRRHGAGWYCDREETPWTWDGCHQRDAGPPIDTPVYGPQACTADSECTLRHGAGWYCAGTPAPPYYDGCQVRDGGVE